MDQAVGGDQCKQLLYTTLLSTIVFPRLTLAGVSSFWFHCCALSLSGSPSVPCFFCLSTNCSTVPKLRRVRGVRKCQLADNMGNLCLCCYTRRESLKTQFSIEDLREIELPVCLSLMTSLHFFYILKQALRQCNVLRYICFKYDD